MIARVLSALGRHQRKKRALSPKAHRHGAVILAAGVGSRMGDAGKTKQMRSLLGKPLIVHTLLAFEQSPYIHEIVVVTRKEELHRFREFRKQYRLTKLKRAVVGGATRQDSAAIGAAALSKECSYLTVHDGARCLVTPTLIEEVAKAAYAIRGAAIAVCPSKDTVKEVDANGYVKRTPSRDTLRLAQTPQIFLRSQYEVMVALARQHGWKVTDDASMAERAGFAVRCVEASEENLKVTTPADLALAELILAERQGGTK